MKLTQSQKKQVRQLAVAEYAHLNATSPRIAKDGAVSVHVDAMPNTNQAGRIFVGWDVDFLSK